MLQLVIVTVVVLFAIPALLYLMGLAARRYIGKAPSWIVSVAPRPLFLIEG
jgi:hypothetical protein